MSTLKADTIVASDGTSPVTLTKQSACKVWSYFNMSGTASLFGSFNVSSLSDLGTGTSKITATNALDSNLNLSVQVSSNSYHSIQNSGPSTNEFYLGTYHSNNAINDGGRNYISAWGDLA